MQRPQPSEYNEYYGLYVGQVPDGEILHILRDGVKRTVDLLAGLSPEQETYRYEPGKWSVREVVGHVIDVERVFGYRALSIARADPVPLPGMDQDVWAASSNAHHRPLAQQLEDFRAARASNVAMLAGFDDAVWERSGTASGYPFSVRTFPWILAGHEIHHRRVLEEKYLKALGAT